MVDWEMVDWENNQEFSGGYNHLPWKSFLIDANISFGKRRPHPIVADDVLTIMLYFNTLLFNWKKIQIVSYFNTKRRTK